MKPGVLIINTSRGPVIRGADLVEALVTGKVLAAGLDVLNLNPCRWIARCVRCTMYV